MSRIEIRLEEEEKQKIHEIAKSKGYSSLSVYIRDVALNVSMDDNEMEFKPEWKPVGKRVEYLRIQLTNNEKMAVLKIVKDYGFRTLSDYVRSVIFNKKYVSKTDVQTVMEFRKIGVNINQIARRLNSLPDENITIDLHQIIKNTLDELNKIINNIIK